MSPVEGELQQFRADSANKTESQLLDYENEKEKEFNNCQRKKWIWLAAVAILGIAAFILLSITSLIFFPVVIGAVYAGREFSKASTEFNNSERLLQEVKGERRKRQRTDNHTSNERHMDLSPRDTYRSPQMTQTLVPTPIDAPKKKPKTPKPTASPQSSASTSAPQAPGFAAPTSMPGFNQVFNFGSGPFGQSPASTPVPAPAPAPIRDVAQPTPAPAPTLDAVAPPNRVDSLEVLPENPTPYQTERHHLHLYNELKKIGAVGETFEHYKGGNLYHELRDAYRNHVNREYNLTPVPTIDERSSGEQLRNYRNALLARHNTRNIDRDPRFLRIAIPAEIPNAQQLVDAEGLERTANRDFVGHDLAFFTHTLAGAQPDLEPGKLNNYYNELVKILDVYNAAAGITNWENAGNDALKNSTLNQVLTIEQTLIEKGHPIEKHIEQELFENEYGTTPNIEASELTKLEEYLNALIERINKHRKVENPRSEVYLVDNGAPISRKVFDAEQELLKFEREYEPPFASNDLYTLFQMQEGPPKDIAEAGYLQSFIDRARAWNLTNPNPQIDIGDGKPTPGNVFRIQKDFEELEANNDSIPKEQKFKARSPRDLMVMAYGEPPSLEKLGVERFARILNNYANNYLRNFPSELKVASGNTNLLDIIKNAEILNKYDKTYPVPTLRQLVDALNGQTPKLEKASGSKGLKDYREKLVNRINLYKAADDQLVVDLDPQATPREISELEKNLGVFENDRKPLESIQIFKIAHGPFPEIEGTSTPEEIEQYGRDIIKRVNYHRLYNDPEPISPIEVQQITPEVILTYQEELKKFEGDFEPHSAGFLYEARLAPIYSQLTSKIESERKEAFGSKDTQIMAEELSVLNDNVVSARQERRRAKQKIIEESRNGKTPSEKTKAEFKRAKQRKDRSIAVLEAYKNMAREYRPNQFKKANKILARNIGKDIGNTPGDLEGSRNGVFDQWMKGRTEYHKAKQKWQDAKTKQDTAAVKHYRNKMRRIKDGIARNLDLAKRHTPSAYKEATRRIKIAKEVRTLHNKFLKQASDQLEKYNSQYAKLNQDVGIARERLEAANTVMKPLYNLRLNMARSRLKSLGEKFTKDFEKSKTKSREKLTKLQEKIEQQVTEERGVEDIGNVNASKTTLEEKLNKLKQMRKKLAELNSPDLEGKREQIKQKAEELRDKLIGIRQNFKEQRTTIKQEIYDEVKREIIRINSNTLLSEAQKIAEIKKARDLGERIINTRKIELRKEKARELKSEIAKQRKSLKQDFGEKVSERVVDKVQKIENARSQFKMQHSGGERTEQQEDILREINEVTPEFLDDLTAEELKIKPTSQELKEAKASKDQAKKELKQADQAYENELVKERLKRANQDNINMVTSELTNLGQLDAAQLSQEKLTSFKERVEAAHPELKKIGAK